MATTLFDAPSPRGTNHAGLFLTKAGHLVDRHGRDWGRSTMKTLALDAALDPPVAFGAERKWTPNDWQASHTRKALEAALQEATEAHGLDDGQHKELLELIHRHLKGEAQEGRGAGATDNDDNDDDADNDDDFAQKVRAYLSGKGLDPKSIDQAVEIVTRNRAAGVDERPQNAIRGGFGGKLSGATKDEVEAEYGGSHMLDLPDYSPDPDRDRLPGYRQSVYAASERAMRRVAGGGVGRRIDTPPGASDAAMSDADLAKEYPGIENVGTSMFGPRG
jgi:hypothetical protein